MVIKKTMPVAVNTLGAVRNEGYVETAFDEVNNRIPFKTFVRENKNNVVIDKSGILKGMIKLGLGVLYFVSLVFFLTQLLT
jgi:hypothetical protein